MKRLLVANRGEIARRIMRTAQRMGIATVAVYSDADSDALHVREAGQAFRLGGAAPAESYLRIDRLIEAARATGADAVHPGYGFLSENADFSQAVVDAGLTWVGPPAEAIRSLGSKSAIKRLAARLGVPCLPGYVGDDQTDDRFASEAARIGYPVMVKAAAGGGGRGMRLVHRAEDLGAALASARSEARGAFGSDELLLERALLSPRHVEVQVFADAHGRCIHLGERDCSVQRRHQKIIEESPSPAVDAALRERMGACAVSLAQGAGYVGAGTVEFLLEPGPEPRFHLMEMNTRLQVEHPVTEALAGVDLVEWQIRVARGEPLPMRQEDVALRGHAIEVRLCAEDEHFTPHAGTVRRFVAPQGVRMDHALAEGLHVSPHYDSMLGKLIAHGATRDEALERLATALEETTVLGLPTNRRLLIECLRDPVFRAGEAGIPFLAERGEALRDALRRRELDDAPWLVAALWCARAGGSAPSSLGLAFERPWRLRCAASTFDSRISESAGELRIQVDGATHAVHVEAAGSAMALTMGDVRRALSIATLGSNEWHVQCGGLDTFVTDASFEPIAGSRTAANLELTAPFNGRIVALSAVPGQLVKAGDTLAVIESMKLEHAVCATHDASIASVHVEPGQQVSPQQVLIRFATP